ncbi:Pancreatic triacylglycerol lipase-like protein [Dinothrombium tinctorium]|uniref:Pancreatic triacylglycerol lipase-like protein n=1 Tax=Dinothrombium tinctorium TaxID=1965070 RepID=A0A3S3PAG8_9ACAR|nr:Pancreatic triacylglycerol lipase-like protein [Dinothrombium tinctorium]
MTDMKDKFLQIEDGNVLLVDWHKGASANLPDQRITNVRMLGSKVSTVLNDLIKIHNTKPENIHIIAHSLGTFAADVIGRQVKHIGRISGLDPGGPNFDLLSPELRLDQSDALFVDVIHTDVENTSLSLYGRGTSALVGHMDFFPNGGSNQPGCSIQRFEDLVIRPIGEGVRRFVACHHYRAIDYYLETITPTATSCLPLGYKCENFTSFTEGRCDKCDSPGVDCAEMGFKSINYFTPNDAKPKKFYLNTNRRKPFCIFHYNIQVTISSKPEQIRGGVLFITSTGEFGSMEARLNGGMSGFRPGNTTGSIVNHFLDIGGVRSVSLVWLPAPSINLFSNPTLYIQKIVVTPLNDPDKSSRSSLTRVLCPAESIILQPFFKRTFFTTADQCASLH